MARVGILGGGQLGLMLAQAASNLNIQVNILDSKTAPAKRVAAHDNHVDGSFTDPEAIKRLAKNCDVLTVEIEHVDTYALEQAATTVKIEPGFKTIRLIQDKFAQKEHLAKFDIPMAEYTEDYAQLKVPFMLKAKKGAYDGKGNYPIRDKADLSKAVEVLKTEVYAEKWVDYRLELAVMVVKTKDGVLSFPTVETVQEDSICKLVYAPPRKVSASVDQAAQDLAKRTVRAFDGKGVFGVEMFLLHDNKLLVNEVAPRPHNSAHLTIEGCRISQFEAHIRAILDLPIPADSLKLRSPAIMLNILAGKGESHRQVEELALSIPCSPHFYWKGSAKERPGRKMGHVTVIAKTMAEAEKTIQPLVGKVDQLRAERLALTWEPSTPSKAPVVGVIMGSDSDLKTLAPGLRLLDDFGVETEVVITSAHRTPVFMAKWSSEAAGRGIRAIIAAAGGAAHLPGMAAAHTPLPVIGVPVKGSALDGVDSLYSIVQMPRGVPVATVGINNSVNAALLALRILGSFDPEMQVKVEQYAKKAEVENLDVKNVELNDLGWQAYLEKMG